MFWSTLMLSPTNSAFVFSSQIRTPSFPINWPSLASTARSPNILWRLWSHKPLHKHDSNKYGSKAFVICDHRSDETRSVTLVLKQSIPGLIHISSAKQSTPLAPHQSEAAFVGERSFSKSWGLRASGSFFPLPLPRHSFFCSLPNFLDELAWKRLLRRLTIILSWLLFT